MRSAFFGLVLSLTAPLIQTARADDQTEKDLVPDAVESKAATAPAPGWRPLFSIGASISFSDSRKVVGAQDGSTWNIGPMLDVGADYLGLEHEWRNLLTIRHVQTKTPAIEEFVKTVDSLVLDSIYLYHSPSLPWIGPFAQFTLTTAMLAGEDVRGNDTNYTITNADGSIVQKLGQKRLALTEPFAPLVLRESVGAFLAPVTKPEVKVEFRAGVGARETLTQNGFAVTDDVATVDVIEVKQLQDYQQAGGELFAGVSGTVTWDELGADRPLTYSVTTETLLPFYSSLDDDKAFADKVTFNFDAKLGVKVFSWMSLDYSFKVVREPLLVDEFQLQNTLLLNFSYVYTGPAAAAAPAP